MRSYTLIWPCKSQDILASHLGIDKADSRISLLHNKLYDDFVEAIDGIDNGISLYPSSVGKPAYISKTDLSSRVAHLNPAWNEDLPSDPKEKEADSMRRFEKASRLAGEEFFDRVDYTWKSWLPARNVIEDALNGRKTAAGADEQGRILIFDQYAAWKVSR